MLNQFQSRYNGFNGDMAQMVSYKSSGGIAAGFAGIKVNAIERKVKERWVIIQSESREQFAKPIQKELKQLKADLVIRDGFCGEKV